MFIPLHDDTPLRVIRFQWMTGGIILLNILLFVFTHYIAGSDSELAILFFYGVVPVELVDRVVPSGVGPVPEPLTMLTYQFLHAGWLHLIANMVFLWVFADNIEDAFGRVPFLFFYLFCGIGAALVHALLAPNSDAPLIGASGAVGGVMAAYMLLYPRARVWILLFMRLPVRIPAAYVLGGWLVLQIIMLFVPSSEPFMVAWWAHIGGFATGFLLTLLFRSRLVLGTP
ncbi:MAG TPA: rhomboid family intramembrane serine protease [Aestuariivirgaceae bacterium]|jgi:membrane associated rhomboid family serine protease